MSIPGPPVTFEPAGPISQKVACTVCGRTGYGTETRLLSRGIHRPAPWQLTCLRGHHPCPTGCGHYLPACIDGAVRWHTRCPALGPTWSTQNHVRTS